MPTLYDSNINYDSTEKFDYSVEYGLIRKDLYVQR